MGWTSMTCVAFFFYDILLELVVILLHLRFLAFFLTLFVILFHCFIPLFFVI